MADDFCSAATAQSQGILRGAAYWYSHWSGRFSANLLDSLFGFVGPSVTPFVTAFVILVWFCVLSWAAYSLGRLGQREMPIALALLTAATLLFAVLEIAPSTAQSLYWGQGMRSVIPPLILGTAYVGLLAKSVSSPTWKLRSIIGAGLVTFAAGGFSETYVAVQTAALVITLIASIYRRSPGLAVRIAGLVGSITALGVVAAAPGNAARRTPFPDPPNLPGLLKISFSGFVDFFNKILASSTNRLVLAGVAAFAVALGALFLRREPRRTVSSGTLGLLPAIGFVLLFICNLPIAYGASLNLPDRTLIIPAFVLVVILFAWFFLLGSRMQSVLSSKSWTIPLAVTLLVGFGVTAVFAGVRRARHGPVFRQYALEWKIRDQTIQAAKSRGEDHVQVPRLINAVNLDEVEPDPKILWLTKCVQDYYGIRVLTDYRGPTDPDAGGRQRQIQAAAERIRPLPESSPAPLNAFYKPGRGVTQFYSTRASYDQVREHFESELIRNGWVLAGKRKLEVFQKYNGAMHVLFCKDGDAAHLFYAGGEAPRLGYDYSIAFNWGLSSGFVWGIEDCAGKPLP